MKKKDYFKIANKKFSSRLIVGTGKYKNFRECEQAVKASGAEIVTVAVRRVNITDKKKPLLMDYIDPKKITYLPNTAGCFNSEEALRTLGIDDDEIKQQLDLFGNTRGPAKEKLRTDIADLLESRINRASDQIKASIPGT